MRWRIDLDMLRDLGWDIEPGGQRPPPQTDTAGRFPNHPFALGSAWSGSGTTWHTTIDTPAGPIKATVTHELVEQDERARVRPVHTSETPWRWRIEGPTLGPQHGSAASPVLAAAAAEDLLRGSGIDVAEPTTTQGHLL